MSNAEHEAEWTTAHLEWRKARCIEMDICGALDTCEAGKCPCALLGDSNH